MKIINHSDTKKAIYQLIPVLILFIDPFNLNLAQRLVFSALLLTIIWWTTELVRRDIACVFLLVVFLIFGSSTPYQILKFAFSPSFYLIMLSFLLSTGISNSKVADRISSLVLKRYGRTPIKLVLLSFLFGIVLIFIIPQPFSRVILLSSIYSVFINKKTDNAEVIEVLLFSIFVSSTTTSMLFINGDIILNYSALQLGGTRITAQEWLRVMFLPSFIANILVFFAFVFTFKSKLKADFFGNFAETAVNDVKENKVSGKEISAAIIMLVVVLLWLTEASHGINAAIVAMIGVIAMFGAGVLSYKDIKTINTGLLLFLITVFAIGTVMKQSGISSLIFAKISAFMPDNNSAVYLLTLTIIVMTLHMFIGSSITTLSVAVPSLVQMTEGMLNPLAVVLLGYIAVSMHYIFPFHHVTIMIGAANKIYSDKLVMKFGLVLTFLTIVSLFCLYIPWWKIIGLI
jgi:di/tricarboxylate transporter